MGNKNYTKYSEKSNNIIKDLDETVVEEVKLVFPQGEGLVVSTEPVDLTVSEDTNVEPKVETNVEPETIEEGDAKLTGVVAGCAKLNVRKEPYKDAEVLCVINKGEEVVFDTEEEATYEHFYKIVTAKGVKGYCMKQFINIK